jgi:hypothetical protein
VALDVFGDRDDLSAVEIEKRLRASGGAFQVRRARERWSRRIERRMSR